MSLPLNVLLRIATDSPSVFNMMIRAIPAISRDVPRGDRIDIMVNFGYDCRVIIEPDNPEFGYYSYLEWTLNGLRHRSDGPAIDARNGDREWWYEGQRHRETRPAIECNDGDREWWYRGQRHRDEGPAIVSKFQVAWYVRGVRTRDESEGPAHMSCDTGNETWYTNGVITRTKYCAMIFADALEIYYLTDGVLTREVGKPAIDSPKRKKRYFIDGVECDINGNILPDDQCDVPRRRSEAEIHDEANAAGITHPWSVAQYVKRETRAEFELHTRYIMPDGSPGPYAVSTQ